MRVVIGVDFDGTIAQYRFPEIGSPVPGAFEWMRKWKEAGADLILWTMRSDGQKNGDILSQAVDFCKAHGIEFFGVNCNPLQHTWTKSQKAYARYYVDDNNVGCPLVDSPENAEKKMVDWSIVGPFVMEKILAESSK